MDQKGFIQYIRDVYKHVSLTIKAVSVGIQALTGQVSAGPGLCNGILARKFSKKSVVEIGKLWHG